MSTPERVGSTWVLTRARDYETPMHVFLREQEGLTRTGYTSRVLDLGAPRAQRLIVTAPDRRGKLYPPGSRIFPPRSGAAARWPLCCW